LSLEFASTSLLDAKHVEYQVRLSPMEVDWLAARERHTRYPALPPGSYRFEARARIGAGAWGPGAELRFSVLPPWWQTRWFFLLVATAGLLSLALGFTWLQRAVLRRRTRQLNQRNEESFRSICSRQAPSSDKALIRFRRENRGLLKWSLTQLFKRALKARLGELRLPAGLKGRLLDAAVTRLGMARQMDRGSDGLCGL